MKHTLKFKIAKETKGALQYKEVDTNGHGTGDDYVIGTLYLRKSSINEPGRTPQWPEDVTITVEC